MSARWAFNGEIVEGTYCTTQGTISQNLILHLPSDKIETSAVFKHIGHIGGGDYCMGFLFLLTMFSPLVVSAWMTIAIAILTFVHIVLPRKFHRKRARNLATALVGITFLYLFLIILVPAVTIPHYYGNTG